MMFFMFACSAHAVQFDVAQPIWTTAEKGEINSSVAFTTHFEWDGKAALKLRLAGCSIFKVFVNGEFAAYGPARGPHGWFRMDEWELSRVAHKGDNHLKIVGVAYNTTTYYIIEHEPFLQAEVLADGKVVRSTGDGKWKASFTDRVRKTQRYSLQRSQSEVYEVSRQSRESLTITNCPAVKLLERGAPYPTFEMDRSYRPTDLLCVTLRTGALGDAPKLWDERSSFVGRTYHTSELKHIPSVDWWKRTIKPMAKVEGKMAKIDATHGVRYEGAVNNTGFLRLKVKVTKPGRLLVGFDEILVNGKLDFLKRFGCNNIVLWDVTEPGEYDFESFEPYTFKFAEVIMLEGAATVEKLEMRTYKNPNATRACMLKDLADRKIFEAARETFAQNAVDVFTDCPSRERAPWLCDSYFTGPAEHFFTGKNEMERTFLRNFAIAEEFPHLPEGMVPMCYPSDHITKNFIPNWSMWFILEIANYFDRTGDRETVNLLRPRVEGLLKFYAQYLNADGALENLPAWVFVEWSHANDSKLVKDGVNWPSNMTYADVLAKAARLYNRPELAEQSKNLKSLMRKRAYDGVWFRDNAKHPDVTETCQYYAFFHGIATPKSHPELWKKLTDEFGPERQAKGLYKDVWPSNAFIGNLLRLIVLKREGHDDQVAREIRGYYLKMAKSTGTLWEHDRPEASCNHAFASALAILLQADFDTYFATKE
jgi:alpha-L-rhamnosidase